MTWDRASAVLEHLDRSGLDAVEPFCLAVGPVRLSIRCAGALGAVLRDYLSDAIAAPGPVDAAIDVIEGQAPTGGPEWLDWAREPGKTGKKDQYHDLVDGRLVYKVRTGVTFLQSPAALVAFGPSADHPNQIVNFINTQILNICQRDGWQICHAAAVTNGERSLAIAGLSGGGKSTSILRLMDLDGLAFVTNDRLLVRAARPFPEALGIPKHPRINPGTILHNPKLSPMLTEERRSELLAMPKDALWQLEEKHDLDIGAVYGAGRVRYDAPLSDFWVLNWSRDSASPTTIAEVALAERPDLLSAIMKSAGPFYQKPDGSFLRDTDPLEPAPYLRALSGVRVSEVSGKIDFDAIARAGAELFATERSEGK
ncbi:HprK-related kinase B [Rhodobacteraceae bacterium NNCM2]|nr:HprK-related kinase B [Coraliihabitans acroporae]